MPFTVEKLPDEPILVLVLTDPFDYQNGPPAIYEKVGKTVGNLPGPLYWILDLTGLNMDFPSWITARAAGFEPSPFSINSGRVYTICVGNSNVVHRGVAIENMHRSKFDLAPVRLFDTLGEALDYARQQTSLA